MNERLVSNAVVFFFDFHSFFSIFLNKFDFFFFVEDILNRHSGGLMIVGRLHSICAVVYTPTV